MVILHHGLAMRGPTIVPRDIAAYIKFASTWPISPNRLTRAPAGSRWRNMRWIIHTTLTMCDLWGGMAPNAQTIAIRLSAAALFVIVMTSRPQH
jgi:hypothetical protein